MTCGRFIASWASRGILCPRAPSVLVYYPDEGTRVRRGRKAIQQLGARDHRCAGADGGMSLSFPSICGTPSSRRRRRQGRPCRSADYSGSCRELSRSARRSKTPIERQGNHEPVEEGVCVLPYSTVCLPPVGSAAATIGPLLVRLRANTRNEQNRKRQPALIDEFLVGHLRSPSSGMSPHCATGAVRIPKLVELAACQTL